MAGMGNVDNEEPRVRPIEPTGAGEPGSRRAWVGVAIVGVAGIAALAVFVGSDAGSEPNTQSTTTALAAPESSTVASDPVPTTNLPVSTSTTSSTLALEPTLSDLLPETEGVLVAAISGQGTQDMELVRWAPAMTRRSVEIPMLGGPVLDFDASGQHMAFLGRSATVGGPALYAGRLDGWAPSRVGVSSFRWHATIPGRIGWMEPGEPPQLCWAGTDPAESLSTAVCVPSTGDELVGFDSSGFLVVDRDTRTVLRLDASGRQVGSLPGTDALVGPDGQVLVVNQDPDARESSFSVADPNLRNAVVLDWAPSNVSGVHGFVAWSPVSHPPELAFLVIPDGERRYQLQLWRLDGSRLQTVNLNGRVWNVEWDSTGRYLLVPGVIGERDHVLQIYDTFALAIVLVHYDNWIQDAHLVTPAVCESATHVIATFADRLPTDVSLETAHMVRSRDAELESWYFVSARVVGGPFDGEIATWAHPGFDGRSVDTTNTPRLAAPINEAARYLGFGTTSLEPAGYDWLQLDGALASQRCVQTADSQ